MTAWNSLGQAASASQNAEAQARLSAQVRRHFPTSKEVMNGEGRWQEPALLVPGATLRDARRWGTEFAQAAVLFGVGARAALVWRGGRVERLWATCIQAPSPGNGSLEADQRLTPAQGWGASQLPDGSVMAWPIHRGRGYTVWL